MVVPYPVSCLSEADAAEFKAILEKHRGSSQVHIQFELDGKRCIMELGPRWRVQSGPQFHKDMEAWTESRRNRPMDNQLCREGAA